MLRNVARPPISTQAVRTMSAAVGSPKKAVKGGLAAGGGSFSKEVNRHPSANNTVALRTLTTQGRQSAEQSGARSGAERAKSAMTMAGLAGMMLGVPLGLQLMTYQQETVEGERIEPGHFVFDEQQFETVGEKASGRTAGSIVQRTGADDFYVRKSVPNAAALWEELMSAFFIREVMGNEDAPKNIIIQTPTEDGKVSYEIASRIMGEGRFDQEPGKDLEKIFSQYNYASELKQHPLVNHGVSLLLDSILGKEIDIKLANQVAFRKADGRNYVYPIDHEQGSSTLNMDRMRRIVVTLDPKELVGLFNDLNPEKATEMRDRAAAEIDGAQTELENAKDNMPLLGTTTASSAYQYLLNDLQNNPDEQKRMLQVVKRIANMAPADVDAMLEKRADLKQILPEQVKENFKEFVQRAQQSCQTYIDKNPDKFS